MTPDTTESKQADRARTLIDEALDACERDEVPAGAVLVALREAEARMMPRVRSERDAHAAEAAKLTAALGEASAPKPTRAPRKPRAQVAVDIPITPEERNAAALRALEADSPQTIADIAKAICVTRSAAETALTDLFADGKITRERAGKGWRYSLAKAAASAGEAAQ